MNREKLKILIGILIGLLLISGVVALVVVRGGDETEEVELQSGRQSGVTPNDEMRVRTAEGAPEIDPESYSLTVRGLVDNPLQLSLEDIKSMDSMERLVELPCVEGWTESGVWKGVRLKDLLDRAGVLEDARTAVFSSPGGYTTSLTMGDVDETDPLLAYEVNGERLPDEQGYPARLVVPDRLGYKWIKWVTDIELIEGDHRGYWESRGYDNEAEVPNR